MSALPVYEVNFVLSERRLNDRRFGSSSTVLPKAVKNDRRNILSRRNEDRKVVYLKPV